MIRTRYLRTFVALLAWAVLTPSTAFGQTVGRDPFVFVSEVDENGRDGSGLAWWLLKATIRPTGTMVAGVTLERLNAKLEDPLEKWCHVSAYSSASFVSPSRRVQAEIDETFRRRGLSVFRVSAPFTGGAPQDAVVGSYETCEGKAGTFLLITDRALPVPGIVYLEAFSDEPGLIWIKHEKDAITLSSCFMCGHAQRLYYDKGRARFYWVNEGD